MRTQTVPPDLEPLRATPGALPADGDTEVVGIPVPEGRRLPINGIGPEAIWAAPQHLTDPQPTITALQAAFPRTGLWPLLTGPEWMHSGYPWGAESEYWVVDPTPPTAGGVDILRQRWATDLDDEESYPQWRPWPGATTPQHPGTTAEVNPLGGAQAYEDSGQLVLVPAARPADVFLTLGPGAFNDRPGPAETCAVLRSWEDRYGALPLRFSGDTLVVAVRRPPRTMAEAWRAATEMKAFCLDTFTNGDDEAEVEGLIGELQWSFWWD